ncbi:MAG: L-histidine N(alpha)-methyltransferase, partial [Gaiellaceae bacterium]
MAKLRLIGYIRVSDVRGRDVLTETSAKFRPEGLRQELDAAGFDVVETWTDTARDFSLTLARRRSQEPRA